MLWGRDGRAWLIDPAAYGGHREVDLAMLRLFGSPGRRFLAAYEERYPLAPGHEERVALYQLFPLLVHAALFGGGYPASRRARRAHGTPREIEDDVAERDRRRGRVDRRCGCTASARSGRPRLMSRRR